MASSLYNHASIIYHNVILAFYIFNSFCADFECLHCLDIKSVANTAIT